MNIHQFGGAVGAALDEEAESSPRRRRTETGRNPPTNKTFAVAFSASPVIRSNDKMPARDASSTMTGWPAWKVAPIVSWARHHFAVFSVEIPKSSAMT
nr:hypothetical protein [Bifidobacterium psychraerophilum]